MKNKATAAVLLAVSSLNVTSANITASLPSMVNIFSDTPGAEFLVKLALTLPALFIAFIAPISGTISDHYGRKKILIISLIIYGIGGFSGYVLKNLTLILAGRALLGLGLGALFTTATAMIGDIFTGETRKKVLSLQGAFVSLGGVLFVGGSGFLADISWRFPFIVYLTSFLILPAAIILLNEPEHQKTEVLNPEIKKIQNPVPLIIFINISVFLAMVFFLMIHTQLPFFLQRLEKNSASLMGIILVLLNLVAFFSASAYIVIRKRLSYTMIFSFFFVFMGMGYILIGSTTGTIGLFAGIIFCGAAAGLIVPNTSIWLQEITSCESRGRIMGIMTASTFSGQFFSPLIMQAVMLFLPKEKLFSSVGLFMIFLGIIYSCIPFIMNYRNRKAKKSIKSRFLTEPDLSP